jgi:hypothetical protein
MSIGASPETEFRASGRMRALHRHLRVRRRRAGFLGRFPEPGKLAGSRPRWVDPWAVPPPGKARRRDRLEDLDHQVGWAAVEVVDVEDDPVDGRQARVGRILARVPRLAGVDGQACQGPEVLANERDDAEVLLVLGAGGPFLNEPVEAPDP